jgi:hypothetical protein
VGMVVGTFQNTAALKQIVDSLNASGVDIDRLRVLTYDEIPTELASTDVQFVWIGDVERASSPGTLGTGTGVPGQSNRSPNEVHGDELLECLSELAIPDGRTDDYARAVEKGLLIVGYPARPDSPDLRALFTSAGATTVEEF